MKRSSDGRGQGGWAPGGDVLRGSIGDVLTKTVTSLREDVAEVEAAHRRDG